MPRITTTDNFKFIQKCFIEAKRSAKEAYEREFKTGVIDPNRIRGVGLEGASRCFVKGTLVETSLGLKKIEEIEKGDLVYSYSFRETKKYLKRVDERHHFKDNQKPLITINFKNGKKITATEDHEFYYKGEWVKLKELVNLWNECRMASDT